MQLTPSPDQQAFRDSTARFLRDKAPLAAVRGLRDDADGFDRGFWRRGAELGWVSLLVGEDNGGGSISGSGLLDLALVAHEFGRTAAPGPLVPCNLVAGALSTAGGHTSLDGLLDGSLAGAWCAGEAGPGGGLGATALTVDVDGDSLVLQGEKRPVEAAEVADVLLVTGRTGEGLTQVLLPSDTPGVTITPLQSVDLTRRFASVRFSGVRVPKSSVVGQVGKAEPEFERQLRQALVLSNAESLGAMQTGFDLTMAWLADRYSFGRPLASYQAIKHRMADLRTWLEASYAIAESAAGAVAGESPDADRLLSAAKAYIGHYGGELLQDCVQLHGGIGVTFEHDLHLYLRRQTANRALYGTPAEHRARLTELAETAEATR